MDTFGKIVAVLLIFCVGNANSVKVSVFYESMCPDSVRFISKQLYPSFLRLQEYIVLDMVPYGKATQVFANDTWTFKCQHGPNECRGNMYQSCALAQKLGQNKEISFINCVMKGRNPSDVSHIESCSKQSGLNWNSISSCATSKEGDNLLSLNGNRTNSLEPVLRKAHFFVPTIVYDDKFDRSLQQQSLKDFSSVVCSTISGPKPSDCDGKRRLR